MPVYKNNDPKQGRYVVAPDGRIVYFEASQKTKSHDRKGQPTGWRDAEQADIDAAPREVLEKCGYLPVATPAPASSPLPIEIPIVVRATGTVTDEPPPTE